MDLEGLTQKLESLRQQVEALQVRAAAILRNQNQIILRVVKLENRDAAQGKRLLRQGEINHNLMLHNKQIAQLTEQVTAVTDQHYTLMERTAPQEHSDATPNGTTVKSRG